MPDLFLYQGEQPPNNVILTDPTALRSSGGTAYTLAVDSGSFLLSGVTANLLVGYRITNAVGTFALTGQNVALLEGSRLVAASGAFAGTGTNASLREGFGVFGQVGAFAVSGQAVTFRVGHVLAADVRSFEISGTPADLIYTPVVGYTLTADPGAFDFAGTAVNFIYTPAVGPIADAVSLLPRRSSRPAPRVVQHYTLAMRAGSFCWRGTAATLGVQHRLRATAARVATTATPAGLVATRRLSIAAGALQYTGSAHLIRGVRMAAQSSQVTLSAPGVRFIVGGGPLDEMRMWWASVPLVPDAVDTAWTDLQRRTDDDEALLLLAGVCDV